MKTRYLKSFLLFILVANSFLACLIYASSSDIKEKKESFFNKLIPYVQEINQDIYSDRKIIRQIVNQIEQNKIVTKSEQEAIINISHKYYNDIDEITPVSLESLLTIVDIIPASLVLAQAAKESAWGTSRFAQDGNNLFGQRCHKQGCGIVPTKRATNTRYEVRKFKSAKNSIKSYIMNLNTHDAYTKLRAIRQNLRVKNEPIKGQYLAKGLLKYSERGKVYTKEIISMIRFNNLEQYNNNFV